MIRLSAAVAALLVAGCADQSKGTALNECRLKYYLGSAAAQSEQVPGCMNAKSFEMTTACTPEPDEHEWDWQVVAFTYDNPKCYRPHGANASIATFLSPM